MTSSPGGASLNTARTLAALEFDCVVHSVGRTGESGMLITAAQAEGLALKLSVGNEPSKDLWSSPSYTAFLQPDGSVLAALADMAAYDAFKSDEVECGVQDWLGIDANLSPDAIGALVQKPSGLTFALAVSPAKIAKLRPHLDGIDLLFCNRDEACVLASLPQDRDAPSWEAIAAALRKIGVMRAVISDGAAAICVLEPEGHCLVAPLSIANPVSVVGAGDALAAGTLAAFQLGSPLPAAVGFGAHLAALALQSTQAVDPDVIRAQIGVLRDLSS